MNTRLQIDDQIKDKTELTYGRLLAYDKDIAEKHKKHLRQRFKSVIN